MIANKEIESINHLMKWSLDICKMSEEQLAEHSRKRYFKEVLEAAYKVGYEDGVRETIEQKHSAPKGDKNGG